MLRRRNLWAFSLASGFALLLVPFSHSTASTGRLIKKGKPLFTIYSPDLVYTQQEYLLARRPQGQLKDSHAPEALESGVSLVRASRTRLLLWDLTAAQIRALKESSKP